jgi:hypothetical protein
MLRLTGGMAVTLMVLGIGLGYRIVQIPDDLDNADDIAYVASLPGYDDNMGGREFRIASERFARAAANTPDHPIPGDTVRRPRVDERLEATMREGWAKTDPALNNWLNAVYDQSPENPDEKPWPVIAAEAANKPGVYDPPTMVGTMASTALGLDNARKMAIAILARGLQQQFQGDATQFVPAFRTVLMLARTIRNGGGCAALEMSIDIERIAMQAADRWLERLTIGHADLTRAMTQILVEGDNPNPFDPRPHILADRYVIRGMMQAPSQWLSPPSANNNAQTEQAAETDLVTVAWTIPWERERTRRLVGMPSESLRPDLGRLLLGRPGSPILQGRARSSAEMADRDMFLRVIRRSVILKTAVRSYRTEHGHSPSTQEELLNGKYLTQLPQDPFADNKPFGYRVSVGEKLVGPARISPPNRPIEDKYEEVVSAGRIIIWSVGYDRVDQGGKVPPGGPRAEDLVYLVPEPAPAK